MGLSAMVPAGSAFIDLLVPVSISIHVEKNVGTCCCFDIGGQVGLSVAATPRLERIAEGA